MSREGHHDIARALDRAEVMQLVVDQLSKDLSMSRDALQMPLDANDPFLRLSTLVHERLKDLSDRSSTDLKAAMYRVDISESHLNDALRAVGLEALAGEVVLRALQKVLTRLRYAGRF